MPEKYNFDFRNEGDQWRFDQLPEEERNRIIEEAHEEALEYQKRYQNEDGSFNREKYLQDFPEDTEKREKPPKFLKVETGRLMHTGKWYEFFGGHDEESDRYYTGMDEEKDNVKKYVEENPDFTIHFGVCGNNNVESNSSLQYIRRQGELSTIHEQTRHEATAVYKKGYHRRIKNFKESGLPFLLPKEIENIEFPQGGWGDYGVSARASSIYNVNEIEALICYRPEDVRAFQELAKKNQIELPPIYLEKPTEQLISFFRERLKEDDFIDEYIGGYFRRTIGAAYESSKEELVTFIESAEASIDKIRKLEAEFYPMLKEGRPHPHAIEAFSRGRKDLSEEEKMKMTRKYFFGLISSNYSAGLNFEGNTIEDLEGTLSEFVDNYNPIPTGGLMAEAIKNLDNLEKSYQEKVKEKNELIKKIKNSEKPEEIYSDFKFENYSTMFFRQQNILWSIFNFEREEVIKKLNLPEESPLFEYELVND